MSTPNDMRKFIGYMKGKKPNNIENTIEENKNMSMRYMLGKMRKIKNPSKKPLNEFVNSSSLIQESNKPDIATNIDKDSEEKKMNNYFKDNNVIIEFEELKVYPSGVIFGGNIDGQINFIYKVTSEEKTSGINVDYLDDFDAQDPENEEIVKKIESYYDIFYKYWRSSLFQN